MAKKYKERQAGIDRQRLERRAPERLPRGLGLHPHRDDRIVVAGKDSDTVPVGTLGSIRRASGLEELR